MEKTFILGYSDNLKVLGGQFFKIPNIEKDEDTNNWIVNLFKENEIEKLVIEINENPNISLQIGYHVRLSIDALREKALIPILFTSTLSLNAIMLKSRIYSQILATTGTCFSEFNQEEIKAEIELIEALSVKDYLTKFLKIIHIQPDETVGRHSLANIWGAFAMDKAANTNALNIDEEFKKKLYFKYVNAFNSIDNLNPSSVKIIGSIAIGAANNIEATGKRILLIDDEADKGWETVLRKVFKTTSIHDFVVISERVKSFNDFSDSAKSIIENQQFDLYLLDLRLNGLDEENIAESSSFSGMQILKKIKSINAGNQVIMFTASNKSWNLKTLIDAGANGYYMKESPEYNFSNKQSEENYNEFCAAVKQSFDLSFLRRINCIHDKCLDFIKTDHVNRRLPYKQFYERTAAAFDIANHLLSKTSVDKKYLNLAFLTYFQIIEDYAAQRENFNFVSKKECYVGPTNLKVIDDASGSIIWKLTMNKDSINGTYFEILDEIKASEETVMALAKVSFILAFIFSKDNIFLKKWAILNNIRNTKAGHGGTSGYVSIPEIEELLEIIELILS